MHLHIASGLRWFNLQITIAQQGDALEAISLELLLRRQPAKFNRYAPSDLKRWADRTYVKKSCNDKNNSKAINRIYYKEH